MLHPLYIMNYVVLEEVEPAEEAILDATEEVAEAEPFAMEF